LDRECGNVQRNICGGAVFWPRRKSSIFSNAIRSLRAFEKNASFVQNSDGLARNNGNRHGATTINESKYKSSLRKLIETKAMVPEDQMADPGLDLKQLAATFRVP
jgi:hypothetical protein